MKYKALPVNSDYAEDIEFRVTNEKGITSNLAECEVSAFPSPSAVNLSKDMM